MPNCCRTCCLPVKPLIRFSPALSLWRRLDELRAAVQFRNDCVLSYTGLIAPPYVTFSHPFSFPALFGVFHYPRQSVRQSPFPQRKVSSMSLCAQSCNISYFFSARVGTLRVEVSHISPWFLLLSGSVFIPPTCLGSLHLHVPVSHLERYGSRNFCASSSWSLWVPFDVFIRTLIFRLLPFSFRDTSPS